MLNQPAGLVCATKVAFSLVFGIVQATNPFKVVMPITKGAEKAHRASLNKRVFNLRRTRVMLDSVKKVRKAIAAGDVAKAESMMPETYQAIDKAVKRGVIKENTAARKKSRLMAAIKKVKA